MTDDARTRVAQRNTPAVRLRQITPGMTLARSYGVPMPEAVEEARVRHREIRMMVGRERPADPIEYARRVVREEDLDKALGREAKARAAQRDRWEIASALEDAAVDEVIVAYHAHLDEIGDGILASEPVARAYAEAAEVAPLIPAMTIPENPGPDPDLRINLARFERARSAFESVLVGLVRADLVALGLDPEGSSTRGYECLLFADPSGADRAAVRRALAGHRPGTNPAPYHTVDDRHAGPVTKRIHPLGIPGALLVATPGVTLSPAEDVETLAERVAYVEEGASGPVSFEAPEDDRAVKVLA